MRRSHSHQDHAGSPESHRGWLDTAREAIKEFGGALLAILILGSLLFIAAGIAHGQEETRNQVDDWCGPGLVGDDGIKLEPVATPFVVPHPSELGIEGVETWELIVLKAGTTSAALGGPITPGDVFPSPTGQEISHVILCYQEGSTPGTTTTTTTTSIPSTTTTDPETTTSSSAPETTTSVPGGSSSTTTGTPSTTVPPTTTTEPPPEGGVATGGGAMARQDTTAIATMLAGLVLALGGGALLTALWLGERSDDE